MIHSIIRSFFRAFLVDGCLFVFVRYYVRLGLTISFLPDSVMILINQHNIKENTKKNVVKREKKGL
jgi:hypothetical protein